MFVAFACVKVREEMNIVYNDRKKDLPLEQLHKIFIAVGWSDDGEMPEKRGCPGRRGI